MGREQNRTEPLIDASPPQQRPVNGKEEMTANETHTLLWVDPFTRLCAPSPLPGAQGHNMTISRTDPFARGTILILFCLMLAGCSTPATRPSQADPAIAELGNPDLLYLLPSPCSRLYVEVDAVEGCVPKESDLQDLRDFLSKYCDKPDGIEIVRSDVIPAKAAKGLSSRALARKYLNGPDRTNASSPAFLYVLYYDDTLGRYPWGTRFLHRGANPQAESLPYPAIYLNTHFSLGIAMNRILLHEAGHELGLVSRSNHARDGHCLNWGCQMNTHVDYLIQFRWLPGRGQSPLCPECVAELTQRATQPPPVNLRFVGPVLVRSETGYHVLSLPDRFRLLLGDQTGEVIEKSCQAFAASVRAEQDYGGGSFRVDCVAPGELFGDPEKVSQTIDRFKNDPSNLVRDGGPKSLLRASYNRYHAIGQYSNAVVTLQQAILFDSEDAWGYNQLAWMEATCSDSSVRNGQAAVTAATKACELTEWKNWQFIDTLAAAYAEAGDFKRAIQYQERALHTGHPTDSEQKAMRGRLSLYRESRPYREKPDKA
jgi:tetratricopeptide (TPR) repeat protein